MRAQSTTTKASFLASLDLHPELTFIGNDGYVYLDDDRRARVTLTIRAKDKIPVQGHWNGVYVEIVSKTKGQVAAQGFAFDGLVTGRLDDRNDYPSEFDGGTVFEVIDYCGWSWYIAVPSDITPLQDAVTGFVELFR